MRGSGVGLLIHPTAIVDSKAELADDVSVGPYSIIGPDVRIGSGTRIGPHVVIKGPTAIGDENEFFQFASIGEDPQDKKYASEITRLEIGDRNVIREYCTMHRGTAQDKGVTRVGDDNLFMAYTHVAHDCEIGNHAIMANGASLAGHVYLGDCAILGGFTLVHQFTKIGQHSFSAMGSAVSQDIPPYVMVGGRPTRPYGINNVGLERKGFRPEAVRQIKQAYKIVYKKGLKLDDAIGQMTEMAVDCPELNIMIDFLRNVTRGILR